MNLRRVARTCHIDSALKLSVEPLIAKSSHSPEPEPHAPRLVALRQAEGELR